MEIRKREVSRHSKLESQCALKLQLTRYRFLYQTRYERSILSLSIIPSKVVCWSSVDATIAAHTPIKVRIAELPPRISAKGPMAIRKREGSFDKWTKWAIQQDMYALAQPVSSITATSTAGQIAQAKEMDTPVKFRGGKRLGSKSIKIRRFRSSWLSRISKRLNLLEGQEICVTWPVSDLPSIR